jgi:hypothetical protein
MADKNLEQSWRITEQHLEAARQHLLLYLPADVKPESLLNYEEWLSHNELELAFDELEHIGLEVQCKQSGFWSELQAAAEEMTLREHTERCKERLRGC